MSKVDELGTLIVVVLKAKDLNDKHSFYKQDAYAQITFNGNFQLIPIVIIFLLVLIRCDEKDPGRYQGRPAPSLGCRISISSHEGLVSEVQADRCIVLGKRA